MATTEVLPADLAITRAVSNACRNIYVYTPLLQVGDDHKKHNAMTAGAL